MPTKILSLREQFFFGRASVSKKASGQLSGKKKLCSENILVGSGDLYKRPLPRA